MLISFSRCCYGDVEANISRKLLIVKFKVQICGPELDVCAQGSSCIMSSISSVYICCQLASPIASTRPPQNSPAHRCANGRTPFYDPGRWFMCSAVYYVWLCSIFWLLVNIQRPTCTVLFLSFVLFAVFLSNDNVKPAAIEMRFQICINFLTDRYYYSLQDMG